MGFLDKAKEAADRAVAATQQAAHQGQAKIASVQTSRSESDLLKSLGEAFYNEQRRGGDKAAVADALAALDQHHAAVGAGQGGQATPAAPSAEAPAADGGAAPAAPPPAAAPAAPAGNFTLEDL